MFTERYINNLATASVGSFLECEQNHHTLDVRYLAPQNASAEYEDEPAGDGGADDEDEWF